MVQSFRLACVLLAVASAAPVAAQECTSLPLIAELGAGTPGSSGIPELDTLGQPMVNQPGMGLQITAGAPGAAAQLIVGSPGTPQFLPAYGARLYPGAPFTRFPLTLGPDGSSPAVLSGPAPTSPALCGLDFVAQGVVTDPAAQGGLAFTGGVRLRFGVGSAAASLFDGACFFVNQTPTGIPTGVRAFGVGDLNDDGRADVVAVAGSSAQTGIASVLLQLDDGSLWIADQVPTGFDHNLARALVVTDLDVDGALDVAIAYNSSDAAQGLSLLRGQGDGSFDAPLVLAAPPDGRPIAVAAADLDGDGLPELVVAAWGNETVGVLPNLGGLTFDTPIELPLGGQPIERNLRVADVTDDGILDLLLARNPAGTITDQLVLIPGLGGLAFGAGQVTDTDFTYLLGLAAGDVDADGDTDVVVTASDHFTPTGVQTGVWEFANLGAGQLAIPTDVDGSDYIDVNDVELVDLDQDGLPELVYGHESLHIQSNLGGSFGPMAMLEVHSDFLAVADMDGDSHADLVTAHSSWVRWIRGLGGEDFAYPAELVSYAPQWTSAGDLDGDGAPDLLVSPPTADVGWIGVLQGAGDGSFEPLVEVECGLQFPSKPALGDMDGDGDLDVVLASGNPGAVVVLRGLGDGSFGAPDSYPADNVATVRTTDLDGDGDLDVVAAKNQFAGGLLIFLGAGDGTLLAPQPVVATFSRLIDVGDVDEDGNPDIVYSTPIQFGTSTLQWLPGVGDGTFLAPVAIVSGDSVFTIGRAADVDLDGHLDLVLIRKLAELSVLRGDGDGAFTLSHTTIARFDASVEVADVNGDGAPDLVGYTTGLGGVLLGFGEGTFAPVQPVGAGGTVADFDGDGDLDTAAGGLVFLNTLH